MKFTLTLLKVIIMSLHFYIPVNSIAQECDDSKASAIDFDRFDINDDGTVTDIESGLTWQRCALGQVWNGATCEGVAESFMWNNAMDIILPANKLPSSTKNWRVPTLSELASIVDVRCKSPRIDLGLFPKTLAKSFWSSNSAPKMPEVAYTLSFGAAGVKKSRKTEMHYVRLVSGRE